MLKYTLKRGVIAVLTVWVIITITFFLMHSIPGDPFTDGKKIPPQIMKNLEAKYGLDKPLIVQYGTYMKNLLKGDLGDSMKYENRSVGNILSEGFPVSAKLGLLAATLGVVVGVSCGVIASLNRGKLPDYLVIIIAVIGVSVPNFVFAALFQYWFGAYLKWFPVGRWGTLSHYVLPVVALGLSMTAYIARMMRTSMLDVLGQDYVKTAKAKGLSKGSIIFKHTIRNAILPVITILGVMIASVLIGSFVVENIFIIPGIGKHYVQSIQQNDYTLILGTTTFYATILVFMMYIIDLLYGLVDPRIRLDQ